MAEEINRLAASVKYKKTLTSAAYLTAEAIGFEPVQVLSGMG